MSEPTSGVGGSAEDKSEQEVGVGGGQAMPEESNPVLVKNEEDELGAGGALASSCLSIMSWGALGEYGAVPGEGGEDAIMSWLNEASTASGAHFIDKPALNSAFLEEYDMVLIHDLSKWEVTASELDEFERWIRGGGSAFVLSGFRDDGAEVPMTNALLSFTGLKYVGEARSGDTATVLSACAYCLGSTHSQAGWNSEHPIARGVTAVGAFEGRSIQGEGQIVAKEQGLNLAMAKVVDRGRVFLFHDEWISFRSQWESDTLTLCQENPSCSEVSPVTSYQIAQLWYNAFYWLSSERECFKLSDPRVVQ